MFASAMTAHEGTPAAAAAGGAPICNSTHWSTEETKLLIKTWGDHRDEFAEIKRNLSVWNKVLERLLSAGFLRTVEQCRNRWKFLETKYKTARREIKASGRTPWEFFDDMEAAKNAVALSPRVPHKARSPTSAMRSSLFTDELGRVQLPPIRSHHRPPAARAANERSPRMCASASSGWAHSPSPRLHGHQGRSASDSTPCRWSADGEPSTSAPVLPSIANAEISAPPSGTAPLLSSNSVARRRAPHLQHHRASSADTFHRLHSRLAPGAEIGGKRAPESMVIPGSVFFGDAAGPAEPPAGLEAGQDGESAAKRRRVSAVELTGDGVRKVDLLEFLKAQAAIREAREAERARERREAERVRAQEEARHHEFQMALLEIVTEKLGPSAVSGDGGAADNGGKGEEASAA